MHSTWIASTRGLFCNLFLTKLRLVGGGWISPGCSQSITVFRVCTRGCGTPKPLCMSLGEGRRGEKWNASSVVLFQRHKCSFTQPGRVFWRPYPWLSHCQTSYHSSTVHCRAWVILDWLWDWSRTTTTAGTDLLFPDLFHQRSRTHCVCTGGYPNTVLQVCFLLNVFLPSSLCKMEKS